ncbi:hypothetical protein MBLNU457_2113t1 [Dothideomycetes sp. NU457]
MPTVIEILESLESRVSRLEDSTSKLKDSIKTLEDSTSKLEDSVSTLKDSTRILKDSVANLQYHTHQSPVSQNHNAAPQAQSQKLNGITHRGNARLDLNAIKWAADTPFASQYSLEIYEDLYGAPIPTIESWIAANATVCLDLAGLHFDMRYDEDWNFEIMRRNAGVSTAQARLDREDLPELLVRVVQNQDMARRDGFEREARLFLDRYCA